MLAGLCSYIVVSNYRQCLDPNVALRGLHKGSYVMLPPMNTVTMFCPAHGEGVNRSGHPNLETFCDCNPIDGLH